MREELKPCPFCGGSARLSSVRDGQEVRCVGCGASGGPAYHGPLNGPTAAARAAEKWHMRPDTLPSPAPDGEVDMHPDNSGLDDGPPLPRAVINCWRDPIMKRLHDAGCSLRAIAAGFGISHEGVRAAIERPSAYAALDRKDGE